jgi:uncharacterized membrane protein YidH (DUF202 family)
LKGKIVILLGDWRQTAPVVQQGKMAEICKASILNSDLWNLFSVHKLSINMRIYALLNNNQFNYDYIEKQKRYAKMLLLIGEGSYDDDLVIKIDNKDYRLKLAIMNSKLSNERTYMAYIRTGLAIAAIALPFKKYKLVALGILMILIGTIEYYYVRYLLNLKTLTVYKDFTYVPLFISVSVLIVLYLEIKEFKNTNFFKIKKMN